MPDAAGNSALDFGATAKMSAFRTVRARGRPDKEEFPHFTGKHLYVFDGAVSQNNFAQLASKLRQSPPIKPKMWELWQKSCHPYKKWMGGGMSKRGPGRGGSGNCKREQREDGGP